MADKVETIIANPNLDKGNAGAKAVKILGYVVSTGISTMLGVWVNGAIKAKATTVNPSVVDGLQIGAGVGIAMIPNGYAQAIGVGQGIAAGISLMQKGIAAIKAKTQAPITQEGEVTADTFG